MIDFLISAGIKPKSIVSYNHLGNNDGRNLSSPPQFRAKELSKSTVIDDMVDSNPILYSDGETPDHCVVIKYVPYVGDSKRALDEYTSEIFLNGLNTIVVHNTCEDSLLAVPIMMDLVLLTELCERITIRDEMTKTEERVSLHLFATVEYKWLCLLCLSACLFVCAFGCFLLCFWLLVRLFVCLFLPENPFHSPF